MTTTTEKKYQFLAPEFRVSTPQELSALENSIELLEENVRMFGGIILPGGKPTGPVSVLVTTLPNGVGITPIYGNQFTSIMPLREGLARISSAEQEKITISIENKLYNVYLREKKLEGM